MKTIEYKSGKFLKFDESNQRLIGACGNEQLIGFEYKLLNALLSKKNNQVFTFRSLMVDVWDYDEITIDGKAEMDFKKNRLNNQWSTLCKKFKKVTGDESHEFLKSDYGIGKHCEYIRCFENSDEEYDGALGLDELNEKIADIYYDQYIKIILRDYNREYNPDLLDVFCYPRFVGNEQLDFSINKNFYICAPNGFGKSTLLKSLLLATNISQKAVRCFKENIDEIRKYYKITDSYLSLFVDLKDVTESRGTFDKTELYEWLFNASGLEYRQGLDIGIDEFKVLIDWYNMNKRLIIFFDSYDEIIEKNIRDNVIEIINHLSGFEGICSQAKVIMASRPLVMQVNDKPYIYLYIDSLNYELDKEKIKTIIGKYTGMYSDECFRFIFEDRYLKGLVVTPQLLTEVIIEFLQNKSGEIHKSIYDIIRDITNNTVMRFKNRGSVTLEGENFEQRPVKHVYETFAYASLFMNNIDNVQGNIEELSELILGNILTSGARHRKPVEYSDISAIYEHFSLLSTHNTQLNFVADKVWRPYFLAGYLYKYYTDEISYYEVAENKKWKMFERIADNRMNDKEILYDMMVFYFAKLHDHPVIEGAAYDAWIDYVLYKWNAQNTSEIDREILKDRMSYLLEGKFIFNSRLERILDEFQNLQKNEIGLRQMIEAIKSVDRF